MKLQTLGCISLVLIATAANAEGRNLKNQVKNACRFVVNTSKTIGEPQPDIFLKGLCMGTIFTIIQIEEVLNDNARFCKPSGVSNLAGLKTVIDYMEKYPSVVEDEELSVVTILAFKDAWPCNN